MEISLIAAMDINHGIGEENNLLCRLGEDMKWFRKNTLGKTIIMGRKTYESIGSPLEDRTNIVLTSNKEYNPDPEVQVFHDIHVALDHLRKKGEEEVMIIGGGSVYEQTLPIADKLYITELDTEFVADAFFPKFDKSEWHDMYTQECTEDVGFKYRFKIYQRKEK